MSRARDLSDLLSSASSNIVFSDGAGIDFGASAGGGSTSELLDDYEEGTWTPSSLPNITIGNGTATGSYIKIGNIVTVNFSLVFGSTTSMGTNPRIFGLPFSADRTHSVLGWIENFGVQEYSIQMVFVANNLFLFLIGTNGIRGTINATTPFSWGTDDKINFQITYIID